MVIKKCSATYESANIPVSNGRHSLCQSDVIYICIFFTDAKDEHILTFVVNFLFIFFSDFSPDLISLIYRF